MLTSCMLSRVAPWVRALRTFVAIVACAICTARVRHGQQLPVNGACTAYQPSGSEVPHDVPQLGTLREFDVVARELMVQRLNGLMYDP